MGKETELSVIASSLFNLNTAMQKEKPKKEIEQNISDTESQLGLTDMPEEIKYEILNKRVNSIIEYDRYLGVLEIIKRIAQEILPLKKISSNFDSIIKHYIRTDLNKILKSYGIDINKVSIVAKKPKTALMIAVEQNNYNMVKLLIEIGADINKRVIGEVPFSNESSNGSTALIWAARKSNKGIVELLISSKAEVNARDFYGNTALCYAAGEGRKDIVESLIKAGAEVDVKSSSVGPLLWAMEEGHIDIVELLIKAGADVNVKYFWGGASALETAIAAGHRDVVALLKQYGAV